MKSNNNFHILIVDDEKFNIELVAAHLKEEGYKLSFAMSALSAIQSVVDKKVDLILLDINMPGKDGFEVCEMLKAEPSTKDIPVTLATYRALLKLAELIISVSLLTGSSLRFGLERIFRTSLIWKR
jgi:CheY-like chemotaxis protein